MNIYDFFEMIIFAAYPSKYHQMSPIQFCVPDGIFRQHAAPFQPFPVRQNWSYDSKETEKSQFFNMILQSIPSINSTKGKMRKKGKGSRDAKMAKLT